MKKKLTVKMIKPVKPIRGIKMTLLRTGAWVIDTKFQDVAHFMKCSNSFSQLAVSACFSRSINISNLRLAKGEERCQRCEWMQHVHIRR